MSTVVERNHTIVLGQVVEHAGVHPATLQCAGEAVGQHDRLTGTGLDVPNPHAVGIEELVLLSCCRSLKSEVFRTRAVGLVWGMRLEGNEEKEFGAQVIGVADWERMVKQLLEDGKIVGEGAYQRERLSVG